MSSAAERRFFTPEEYLALERSAPFKSEYHDGEIFAMSGVSREHNRIALNFASRLNSQFTDGPCEAFIADMRVRVTRTDLYTYPDVVAVCGEARFEDDEVDTLLNPILVVEVLSPSTEGYDRGKKFGHYRRIDSLREYVLISQDRACVEQYTLQEDRWVLKESNRRDDVLRLTSVGSEISLRDLYARVEVPEGEPTVDAGREG